MGKKKEIETKDIYKKKKTTLKTMHKNIKIQKKKNTTTTRGKYILKPNKIDKNMQKTKHIEVKQKIKNKGKDLYISQKKKIQIKT